MSELNAAALAFIDKYSAELQKDDKGMPAAFNAKFNAAKTDFDTLLN